MMGDGAEKRESSNIVGMNVGAAIMENSKEFPQKLRIELPYDPAI